MTALALVASAALLGAAPSDDVSQDRLMGYLRALPAERSASGTEAEAAGLRATERLLIETVKGLGYEVSALPVPWAPRWRDIEPPAEPWNNIVFELPGTAEPDEVVLIGAHFDAVPGSPGADDNGTGVAGLLELATVYADRPRPRTIRFALYTLEEVGLVGSTHDAGAWLPEMTAAGGELVAMLSLEMLGYYSDEPGSQRSPIGAIPGVFEPPTVGNTIILATTVQHRPVALRIEEAMAALGESQPDLSVPPAFRFDFAPVPVPDILRSDHAPFLLAGLPGIMVTDSSNFRNPHYHQPTDTVETIDAGRFTGCVAGLAAALWELTEAEGAGEDGGG